MFILFEKALDSQLTTGLVTTGHVLLERASYGYTDVNAMYSQDKEPKGIIPLENIQVREVSDRNKPHCFELHAANNDVIKACKTDSEGKVVEGQPTTLTASSTVVDKIQLQTGNK